MQLFLYNTLTKSKQAFVPIDSTKIRMYVCGPTVYDLIHIGNARTNIVYDILYRILINMYGSKYVQYARNITDIDDKIILRANELGVSIKELTDKTIKEFEIDNEYLECLKPDFQPKATECVNSIIAMISTLIEQECAYISQNHVYFAINKASNYTALAGRKLEDLISASEHEPSKKSKGDFVLWKPAKHAENCSFDSPWGKGRPGWHIECSAMSNEVFGPNFDIHGGGIDLIFPHHTNEIAQSICAYPKSDYARFWVHTGFLTHKKEKMSKSLGNFVTVRDMQSRLISSETFRIFILNTHYRKPIDFSEKNLQESAVKIRYLYNALKISQYSKNTKYDKTQIENCSLPSEFMSCLLDDMNTHMAVDYIYNLAQKIHESCFDLKTVINFVECANFLGLLSNKILPTNSSCLSEPKVQQIERLINQRKVAREQKRWKIADKIRINLLKVGIYLDDHQNGSTTWKCLNSDQIRSD
jgi:cysteinyl-tRNA synthetase